MNSSKLIVTAAIIFALFLPLDGSPQGAALTPYQEPPLTSYQMEAAAVGGIRTISAAQQLYARNYPEEGFACSWTQLGPSPNGQLSKDAAGLLDASFMTGKLDGYSYELLCPRAEKPVKKYTLAATPLLPNTDKMRAFCTSETGVISAAMDGKSKTCFRKGKKI